MLTSTILQDSQHTGMGRLRNIWHIGVHSMGRNQIGYTSFPSWQLLSAASSEALLGGLSRLSLSAAPLGGPLQQSPGRPLRQPLSEVVLMGPSHRPNSLRCCPHCTQPWRIPFGLVHPLCGFLVSASRTQSSTTHVTHAGPPPAGCSDASFKGGWADHNQTPAALLHAAPHHRKGLACVCHAARGSMREPWTPPPPPQKGAQLTAPPKSYRD